MKNTELRGFDMICVPPFGGNFKEFMMADKRYEFSLSEQNLLLQAVTMLEASCRRQAKNTTHPGVAKAYEEMLPQVMALKVKVAK